MMLHFGRCGSTVLANLLRQNESIFWDSEVLQRHKERKLPEKALTTDPRRVMKLRYFRAGARNYGVELKPLPFMHLSRDQLHMNVEEFFPYVEKMGFNRIIFLQRRHYLRKLTSLTIARDYNRYESAPNSSAVLIRGVRIDCSETAFNGIPMRDLFETYDDISKSILEWGSKLGDRFLLLEYADHIKDDPLIAYNQVCGFVGIKANQVELKNARVNPQPLDDLIDNFDEVKKYLADTPYHWMTERDEA